MEIIQISQLTLTVIALITVFIILFALLREFHYDKKYTVVKPPRAILINSYFTIASLSISMMSSIYNLSANPSFLLDIVNDTVTIITWSVGQLFVFTIIMSRIHYISSNTKYELAEHNYIIFAILIFVCILLCIVWILRSILYYNQYKNGHISQTGVEEFGLFFVLAVAVIESVISIFFVAIFINKSIQITKRLIEWTISGNFDKEYISFKKHYKGKYGKQHYPKSAEYARISFKRKGIFNGLQDIIQLLLVYYTMNAPQPATESNQKVFQNRENKVVAKLL